MKIYFVSISMFLNTVNHLGLQEDTHYCPNATCWCVNCQLICMQKVHLSNVPIFLHIWQNPPKRASFWQNIFPFTVLSNPNFPKCSVKDVVLSKQSQKCSVKNRWISVKHWWLLWQCAVLSKSAVMLDRTVLVFDRNPVES